MPEGWRRGHRTPLGKSEKTTEDHHTGDDATQLGAVHLVLYGGHRSRYLTGWISHYRLWGRRPSKDLGVIDAHVRRRVRAIIVRQKKQQRFLFRHLRAKGVGVKTAAGCGQSHGERSMGEVEPPGDDASLSAVLVRRADEIAQSPVATAFTHRRYQPSWCWDLIDRSKEPYAWSARTAP